MRNIIILILLALPITMHAQVKVLELKVENQKNPLGVDVNPRFSWQLVSEKRNVMQNAFEIRVSDLQATLSKANVWSSGKVNSDQSLFVEFKGASLQSGKNISGIACMG